MKLANPGIPVVVCINKRRNDSHTLASRNTLAKPTTLLSTLTSVLLSVASSDVLLHEILPGNVLPLKRRLFRQDCGSIGYCRHYKSGVAMLAETPRQSKT